MKIRVLTAAGLLTASVAFADTYIGLSKTSLMCGSYKITQASKYGELTKNCKATGTDTDVEVNGIEKEVKFVSENGGAIVKCKFLNAELKLCKIDD